MPSTLASANDLTTLQALPTASETALPTTQSLTTLQSLCQTYNGANGRYNTLLTYLKPNLEAFVRKYDEKYNALSQQVKNANPYTSPLVNNALPASITPQQLLTLMTSYAGYTPISPSPSPTISYTSTYTAAVSQADALTILLDFSTLYSDLASNLSLLRALSSSDASLVTTLSTAANNIITGVYTTNLAKAVTDSAAYTRNINDALGLAQRNLQTILTDYQNLYTAYTTLKANAGIGVLPSLPDVTAPTTTTTTVPTPSYTPKAGNYTTTRVGSVDVYGTITNYTSFQTLRETVAQYTAFVTSIQSNYSSFVTSVSRSITTVAPFSVRSTTFLEHYYAASTTTQSAMTAVQQTIATWYDTEFTQNTYNPGLRFLTDADITQQIRDYVRAPPTQNRVQAVVNAMEDMVRALVSRFETTLTEWVNRRNLSTTVTLPVSIATDKTSTSIAVRNQYLGLWATLIADMKTHTTNAVQRTLALQNWYTSRGTVTVGTQTTTGLGR
jgi:hypothetical protein